MEILNEVINTYALRIVETIVVGLMGYIGLMIKFAYTKYVNNQIKHDVVVTCVKAIEQLYKDLHGDEKLAKCINSVTEMLGERGIIVTELEIRMLIESAVKEMNDKLALDTH